MKRQRYLNIFFEENYTRSILINGVNRSRKNTQSNATASPTTPPKKPPKLKSDCRIIPVLNTIALGGVETGRKSPQEEQSPITKPTGRI